jgi:hypothetical protein
MHGEEQEEMRAVDFWDLQLQRQHPIQSRG